jgi:hypothetical protein
MIVNHVYSLYLENYIVPSIIFFVIGIMLLPMEITPILNVFGYLLCALSMALTLRSSMDIAGRYTVHSLPGMRYNH